MKKLEKDKAIALRLKGYSINEIVLMLGVAKSSVSLWVRNIELSDQQKRRLSKQGRTLDSIERRRKTRLSNEKTKRSVPFDHARSSMQEVSPRELLFLGLGLYWGEGSKTSRGSVAFYNSDPQIIQTMLRFYREICHVPESKIKARIFLHPHLNEYLAKQYWSDISQIPLSNFTKTGIQQSKASKGLKDTLPHGTFEISVYDTSLYLKIMGWLQGVYAELIPESKRVESKYNQYL